MNTVLVGTDVVLLLVAFPQGVFASASPKLRVFVSRPSSYAWSTDNRRVPLCSELQRSPDSREPKKWTKWQKLWMTSASKVPLGVRKDTTVSAGSTSLTPSGATTREIFSFVTGSVDSTLAVFPRIPGMNKLSHAHQVYMFRPATWKRWDICGRASPQNPITALVSL